MKGSIMAEILGEFKAEREEGIKEDNKCITPSEVIAKKRKKGYLKGTDTIIKKLDLKRENYKSEFKTIPNKEKKGLRYIFGTIRKFE